MFALKPWVGPSLEYLVLVPTGSSTPNPFALFLLLLFHQKQATGVLGDPGLVVVEAVEEACEAGPEPVTSHHPRA